MPRRQLGRYLKQAREEARLTLKEAAERLEVSPQKIWRLETGRGQERVRSFDVEVMCRVYGVAPEMSEALVGLARETTSRGWWQSYGDAVPTWFELYVGLEAAARRIRQFEPALIPGLLQTRHYAAAIFQLDPDIGEDELDQKLGVRLERQELLMRAKPPAPDLEVILSEAVLRQPIRDRKAMAGQLGHLLERTELPNVSIRVAPLAAGPHPASVAGAFFLLDFPSANGGGPGEPATVYSGSLTGALYLDKPAEVAAYEQVWEALCSLALDEGESKKMINMIIGEIQSE